MNCARFTAGRASSLENRPASQDIGAQYPGQSRLVPFPNRERMMDLKLLPIVFASVSAAVKEASKLTVFAGAALALVLTSAIGVLAGGFISQHVSARTLHTLAGAGFIAIGIWTLARA